MNVHEDPRVLAMCRAARAIPSHGSVQGETVRIKRPVYLTRTEEESDQEPVMNGLYAGDED